MCVCVLVLLHGARVDRRGSEGATMTFSHHHASPAVCGCEWLMAASVLGCFISVCFYANRTLQKSVSTIPHVWSRVCVCVWYCFIFFIVGNVLLIF